MRIGSPEHRELFCRQFIETHVPFEPQELAWPVLDARTTELLRAFPLWGYARTIEQRAGRMVTAYARTVEDPLIREAIALQGYEETRHGRLLAHALERYGIAAPALDISDPRAVEEDWLLFGFGECTDSFVGFGGFALARERGVFPPDLIAIFDHVLYEEARHITFFVNWYRYEQAIRGRGGFLRDAFASLRFQLRAALDAASRPDLAQMPATNFVEMLELDGVGASDVLAAALDENRRMMGRLHPQLVKPVVTPALATLALLGIRLLPPRSQRPRVRAVQAA